MQANDSNNTNSSSVNASSISANQLFASQLVAAAAVASNAVGKNILSPTPQTDDIKPQTIQSQSLIGMNKLIETRDVSFYNVINCIKFLYIFYSIQLFF